MPAVAAAPSPCDAALAEVRATIGGRPAGGHRPELLVDHLHALDEAWGGLHEAHLAALAAEMGLPLARVRSAAAAGPFQLLPQGAQAPALTVRVCAGLTCKLAGASALLRQLPSMLGADVRVLAVPCLGRCEQAPAALVGQVPVAPASAEGILNTLRAECARPPGQLGAARGVADPVDFLAYRAQGGYALAARLYEGQQEPGSVLQALAQAGAPAASLASRDHGSPALLAVHVGATEPGRFQERHALERDPHRLLEGLLLAAYASGAPAAALHLRDDWHDCRRLLGQELARLQASPPCLLPRIELRSGAGAPQAGALALDFDHVFWLRELVEKGPGWLDGLGRRGRHGLRAIGVSGAVNRPGVKLVPAGITLRELVDEYCDGLPPGQVLQGFVRGGAPGGMLPAALADLPLGGDDPHAPARQVASLAVVVLAQPAEGGMQAGGTMGRSPLYRTAP